uniref:protein-S-isoprenylcysteine alpha-carbonyl methylesterase n=1 Tax=Elaeis guineensis var. tenera TaxID=51953 RepID=A0A8N4F8V5_ELAGV|nr:probable isoprenylcysteine alpha-carbonyl methylesterase ICMEL2 isoform X3 [Elaeis guineensis]
MAEAAGDRRPAAVEDANIEKPLLRWSPSSNMRRRASGDLSLGLSCPSRRPSFRRDVGHAAAETYRITRLALTLLQYLGVGYRWMTKFLALACYAILLMPGFLQVGYYYFFSTQVRRSIVYGEQPRNRLDLYLPKDSNEPKPVVAFVTGGAWIIGYKAWGALLGRRLAERDIIVACIDYRNFPQGTISDMITDASEGISFICNNIASYGGDPHRVYLMGQSAGAHIAACTLLEQAIKEAAGESITWSVSQIKAYVGLSGGLPSFHENYQQEPHYGVGHLAYLQKGLEPPPCKVVHRHSETSHIIRSGGLDLPTIRYNMLNLVDHFHERGLYRSIFLSIMEGEENLRRYSPEVVVRGSSFRQAIPLLPYIILFHGTADYSIPSSARVLAIDAEGSVGHLQT